MKDRLHSGELYFPVDEDLKQIQRECLAKLYQFNHMPPELKPQRKELIKEMFGSMGEGCYIEPPFYASWGGRHIHFGKNVYVNFGMTCVDDTYIYVGDDCQFGPNVTIATANHPMDPTLRKEGYQYNLPVKIGNNCWIGAGVIIVPGVTIGDNVVVGAGSVVTKDIPSNVVAVGNPCRVLREIGEYDKEYYYRNRKIELTK